MYSCWIIYTVFIGWIISAGASHPPNLNAFRINNAFTLPLTCEMRWGQCLAEKWQRHEALVSKVLTVGTQCPASKDISVMRSSYGCRRCERPFGRRVTAHSRWLLAHAPCKEVSFYEGDDSLAQRPESGQDPASLQVHGWATRLHSALGPVLGRRWDTWPLSTCLCVILLL